MVGLGWVGLVAEWVGGRVAASVTFVGDAADSFFFFFSPEEDAAVLPF